MGGLHVLRRQTTAQEVRVPNLDEPPARMCCGKKHWGAVCPDGKVMCCICFERFDIEELSRDENGERQDVCQSCKDKEDDRLRETEDREVH